MKKVFFMLSMICLGLWACAGAKVEKPSGVKPLVASKEETPNQCPEITNLSVSDSPINAGEQTRIAVTASDPDPNHLFYFWSASRGNLTGRESQVVWTAPKCSAIGKMTETYEISVEVSDGKCKVDRSTTVAVNCGVGQTSEKVIRFPKGSTKLDQIAKAQLDTIAALLKQFPDQTIRLEGHTDARGKEQVNQQIGLKRAESVKQYLVQRHGLDPHRMTTISYGSTKPVDTNDTEAGRAQNRRVEIYQKF